MKSEGEDVLAIHLDELDINYERDALVCPERKWKWDFLLLDDYAGIAIEVDGFFKGRHGRGWGSDYEKQNWGMLNGVRVLRFTSTQAKDGSAKAFLAEWLKTA